MRKFKDHYCFEQFIKAQIREMTQYKILHKAIDQEADRSIIAVWIVDHARQFRENYIIQHPNDFID